VRNMHNAHNTHFAQAMREMRDAQHMHNMHTYEALHIAPHCIIPHAVARRENDRARTGWDGARARRAKPVSSIDTASARRFAVPSDTRARANIDCYYIPSFDQQANEHRDVFYATPHACDCVAREPPGHVASGACAMCAAQIISIL
jgi:hypothetical protein